MHGGGHRVLVLTIKMISKSKNPSPSFPYAPRDRKQSEIFLIREQKNMFWLIPFHWGHAKEMHLLIPTELVYDFPNTELRIC